MAVKTAPKRSTSSSNGKSAHSARPARAAKYVYFFGAGKADGDATMKGLLGGKGANLAEMCRIGLPVPPGFTITTEVCTWYYDNRKSYPKVLDAQVEQAISRLEQMTGKRFGDLKNPLLVSVRSPDEVEAALGGGAGLIDVKEPARGALGRADEGFLARHAQGGRRDAGKERSPRGVRLRARARTARRR